MNRKKIEQLKRELVVLRRSPQKARDLEAFAKKLGRQKAERGKEPVWVNPELNVYPVAIPHHGGRDIPIGTKNNILDSLEEDLIALEEREDDEEL